PYLQLVFLSKKEDAKGVVATEEIEPGARLIEVSGILKEGDIEIRSTETVKEVERRFEKQYGLPVRILRKQKGVWLDTIVTDDLTLHEQNTWGREASKPLKIKLDDRFNWNNLSAGK
ncbi:MAG TPA: hypothetical protein VI385_06845, partial [Flavisolibacter sp.]